MGKANVKLFGFVVLSTMYISSLANKIVVVECCTTNPQHRSRHFKMWICYSRRNQRLAVFGDYTIASATIVGLFVVSVDEALVCLCVCAHGRPAEIRMTSSDQ